MKLKEVIYKIRGHEVVKGDKLWETGEIVSYVIDHDHKIEYGVKGSATVGNFTWGQQVIVVRLEEIKE